MKDKKIIMALSYEEVIWIKSALMKEKIRVSKNQEYNSILSNVYKRMSEAIDKMDEDYK